MRRTAIKDAELGGKQIKAGDEVVRVRSNFVKGFTALPVQLHAK